MGRKNYEERLVKIRVPKGAQLSPSKKVPGALSPLVHGRKGVKAQAVVLPVRSGDGSRGFLGSLLAFSVKAVLAILGVGVLLVLVATLLSAVIDGVAAGLDTVAEAAATVSSYLVVGAVSLAILLLVVGSLRASWPRIHRRRLARGSAPGSTAMSPAAHTMRAPVGASRATPANWYVDPWDTRQLRYWDGVAWTGHVSPRDRGPKPAASVTSQECHTVATQREGAHRVAMSSAEWQNLVRTWVAAGAVERALWQRLVHARISDADQLILEAQSRMEQLTPEVGAQKARLMLEANPGLRDELPIRDILALLLTSAAVRRVEPVPVEQRAEGRGDGHQRWLL